MEEYNEFRKAKDKFNALYMIIVRNRSKGQLIKDVTHKLNIVKQTKDPYKRNYRLNRLYQFIKYIENPLIDGDLSHVFFVGNIIHHIKIDAIFIETLDSFQVHNTIIKEDNIYDIDYLQNLFQDNSYKNVLYIKNDDMTHIHLNKTKIRIYSNNNLKNIKLEDYILENLKEPSVIHGISVHLKNLKLPNHFVFSKKIDNDQIFNTFTTADMTIYHKKVTECINNLIRSGDKKIVVGKDIVKAIKNYLIKTIYCTIDKEKILRNNYNKYINFDIIIVKSLDQNDIVTTLIRDYKGLIGVKYY